MTDTTPNLALPELIAAQAQKHVTVNEALHALDVLVQLAVLDRDLSAPPASPAEGQRWLIAASPTGDWAGHAQEIAAWQHGGWEFYAPQAGWLVFAVDEGALLAWTGSAWIDAGGTPTSLDNVPLLGIGTTADASNPFSAKLNNALWVAQSAAEGGDGTLRYKMSKESADKTLSVLFQDNFSGRAELGLTGDDDFHVKVSPDGSVWTDALTIDRTTGIARVQGLASAVTGAALSNLLFTPGGEGTISIWRVDNSHSQNPRAATVSSVAGDIITLTSAIAPTLASWPSSMAGVSYVRIWNVSKAPVESAWVVESPSASTLKVLEADDIAGWANGETIQLGDPTTVTPGRVIALDISPMLQNLFGATFRQTGIVVKAALIAASNDSIDLSPNGTGGSFVGAASPGIASGVTIVPCTELSPISNSNLVFVRENIATTATVSLVSSVAVLA